MISLSKIGFACGGLFLLALCSQVIASTKAQLQALVPQLQSLAAQNSIVEAVDAANQAHAQLSSNDIRSLGKEWHAGLSGKASPILTQVNGSDLSNALKNILKYFALTVLFLALPACLESF